MSAKATVKRNKTVILANLCADYRLILNKAQENELITQRDYNNLKSINKENAEGHVIELVDNIMNKGESSCQAFLNLLQTDEDIKNTYPELKIIQLNDASHLQKSVQISIPDGAPPESKRRKEDEQYQLNSQPTGLCVIFNNENFIDGDVRNGTNKDAQSLAKVFTWLGFRVLMCKDQTTEKMDEALKCFATLSDPCQLLEFGVKEWSDGEITDLKDAPKHGDAFICCILSHGQNDVVLGTDKKSLPIKQITTTFKATDQSALTGKPKLFLIQACRGGQKHPGVLLNGLQADAAQIQFIPEEADLLVACATVEDHVSYRHKIDGSWFVQSLCQQLKEGCTRGEDTATILCRVNDEVSQKEASSSQPGAAKQMPEFRSTLRKKLVFSPKCHPIPANCGRTY